MVPRGDGAPGTRRGNCDENRDRGRDGNEEDDRNEHEGRDGGEGRESLGTYKVVLKVGRKARDGGLCQRVTINQSHKTRLVASCEEPEGQDRVGRRSGE